MPDDCPLLPGRVAGISVNAEPFSEGPCYVVTSDLSSDTSQRRVVVVQFGNDYVKIDEASLDML